MTTTHRRPHRLTRIALVTAVAIFSAGGCLSVFSGFGRGLTLKQQLVEAAWHGNLESIRDLLDLGVNIEARWNGYTALMTASGYGEVAAVRLLLDRGADIGARNDDGETALMAASWEGQVAAVELLLDRGANIEAQDDNGWTPLMWASGEGKVAAVELLLDRGADIDAQTDKGNTALMLAFNNGYDEVAAVLRAWATEPGGRQDTRPALAQSQQPAGRTPGREPNKTALLIANAGYDHFSPLTTPLQEARQLGAALKRIGFEVEMLTDGSQYQMREALFRFEERVRERGGTALFHYGGHGVQVAGVNYLLPVDQNIPDERRVRSLAISADEISGALQAARSTANIVILDACRDNPLPRETRSTDVRGLAPVNDPPPNTLIVFAADGGQVAKDGLFTPALLRYIEQPGIEVTEMLRQVRRDVSEASDGQQWPANYDKLVTEVYLAGGPR